MEFVNILKIIKHQDSHPFDGNISIFKTPSLICFKDIDIIINLIVILEGRITFALIHVNTKVILKEITTFAFTP